MNPNTKRHSPRGLLGPGKGDAPRHKLDDNYRANFDAINWNRKTFCIEHSDGTIEKLHAKAMRIIRYYGKSLGTQ